MDRFIESDIASTISISPYLKSNMDRFIVIALLNSNIYKTNLKSNMDRFIEIKEVKNESKNYI